MFTGEQVDLNKFPYGIKFGFIVEYPVEALQQNTTEQQKTRIVFFPPGKASP